MFGDVVNHVDDLRNFQRTIAQRFDLLRRSLHRRSNALHTIERIAHSAVSLFGSVQRSARRFGGGFSVVRHLFHRHRQLFHCGGSIGDLLVLLNGAAGHIFRGEQYFVRAGGNVNGGLTHALEHLHEVLKHVVHGINNVAERVVGNPPAQREITAGNLAYNRKEFRNALL